jgi:uncharacterized repeat protein (TIGR01451 family)
MRSSPRRRRAVLALAATLLVVALSPAAASATITATSAKLDEVTSTSSPPGSVIPAQVTADVSSGTWSATSVQFGSQSGNCINHDNQSAGSNRKAGFNVTAPGGPGNYNVGFTPNESSDCKGTAGTGTTLTNGLRVTEPAANPNLPPRCGINVMLVLDKSGSIESSGATESVRQATRAFLAALSGTGAAVSITDFSTSAAQQVDYTTVTPDSINNIFNPYLINKYKPSGWTNWEDAFNVVAQANTRRKADLVVFITDGDPTARNNPPGNPITGLTEGAVSAMRPAAVEADKVKGQGSHVFAMGVGEAVTKETSARRLTAISGFDQFPATPLEQADYTLVSDFDDLAKALRQIATELCQASITVTKLVDEGDGTYRPDSGWTFTATVSTDRGSYKWVQPAPPPNTGPRSRTTNVDGIATFQWKPEDSTATSTVSLDEDLQPGYQFVDAVCVRNTTNRGRRITIRRSSEPVTTLTLKPLEYFKCTVRNKIIPGTIEIEKEATPQSADKFPFNGSLGDFSLVDSGSGSASSRTFTDLAPGTYTVNELVPADWRLSGVSCTPAGAATIAGATATITLPPGGSVVCTYRDAQNQPPVPPEPPTPPTPPTPPGPPAPPTHPPATTLEVVKTAPRVARVGERIPFRLKVTNTGSVAATSVLLLDIPPAAVTLSALQSRTRASLNRGNAFWRLGPLAPGASRTVTGTVRLKAGTPGLKRNLTAATAINAKIATDRADTRLLARRRAPAVTG